MARRGKTSPAEDLMDLVALLPWWAGVGLAVASYLVLHAVAAQPIVVSAQPGQIGATVSASIWKGLATAGQYIAPLICLGGAGLSAWRRCQRKRLVNDVAETQGADALNGMRWQEFEMLVGESFRLQGFQVVETGGGGADGGVDLVLSKPAQNGHEKFLVQCKQWRAYKVGVDVVRELYGVMAARGAAGGFVVTSGRYTDEAKQFAEGRNVKLIDGPQLHRMIRDARVGGGATRPASPSPASQPAAERPSAGGSPNCPLCSKPMIQRTAKRGANAGSSFWGCSGYPACRGTRPSA